MAGQTRLALIRLEPRPGDVIVSGGPHMGEAWTIRQLPGPAQLSARSREEAERLATAFAAAGGVRAWWSDGTSHRRLDAGVERPPASPESAEVVTINEIDSAVPSHPGEARVGVFATPRRVGEPPGPPVRTGKLRA